MDNINKLNKTYKHTINVIDLALKKSVELKIKDFVIASCTGKTAELFLARLEYFAESGLLNNPAIDNNKKYSPAVPNYGLNIVCVTHQIGFSEPNSDEMSREVRDRLDNEGLKVLTTTHLLGGVDRALRMQFEGIYPTEIVSSSLRIFGQGTKVCIEISVMAADAGLVKAYSNIIAIGGTGSGADTAAVISPAHSQDFFKTRVLEVICKPSDF